MWFLKPDFFAGRDSNIELAFISTMPYNTTLKPRAFEKQYTRSRAG